MGSILSAAANGGFPLNLYAAFRNASLEGAQLADALIQKIDAGEVSPNQISLVGDSFGGVVNGVAARIIHSRYTPTLGEASARIGEIQLLDTPQIGLFLPATSTIDPRSANVVYNLFGARDELAFGGPIAGPNVVNVGIDLAGRANVGLGHNEIADLWPDLTDPIHALAPGNYHEVHGASSAIVSGLPSYTFGAAFGGFGAAGVFNVAVEQLQYWAGQGARAVIIGGDVVTQLGDTNADSSTLLTSDSSSVVNADDQPFHQIIRELTVPRNAHFLQFAYMLEMPANGDFLSISFGDTLLFRLPLFGTTNGFTMSDPIYIGDFAGVTNQLAITLMSTDAAGAQVYLTDMILYSPLTVPEPSTLVMSVAGGLSLLVLAGRMPRDLPRCHRVRGNDLYLAS